MIMAYPFQVRKVSIFFSKMQINDCFFTEMGNTAIVNKSQILPFWLTTNERPAIFI